METISVVLTTCPGFVPRLISLLSGFGYTHAFISLDEKQEKMFSFNYRGFCEEPRSKFRRHGVSESRTYQLHRILYNTI